MICRKNMLGMVFFMVFLLGSSSEALSSLFRSAELPLTRHDWIVESVKILPIDDGNLKTSNTYQSYLIYREQSSDNTTSFILDLQVNEDFNQHIPIDYDKGEETIRSNGSNCLFFRGSVRHWGASDSLVAISNCSGFAGLIHHAQERMDYFLEPILNDTDHSYILTYQRKLSENKYPLWSCEVNSSIARFNPLKSTRRRRSIIRERFIETLLVADASVSEYFAHSHVTELYLLTMMNMVYSIYTHASLGYPVTIVLTRIIMLSNQSDFQMASKSHETLNQFCVWQEQLKKNDKKNRTVHHDVSVFLTRKSLCQANSTCTTIGLAHKAGICLVNRSCNINQDLGLISAFTIAHEIGHNLGLSHDGDKNRCSGNSESTNSDTIMVPNYAKVPMNMWSQCSRDDLTDFFDQGWGKCLNNKPTIIKPFDDILPGIIFDLDEQCRLTVGPQSVYCFLGDEPPIDVCYQMMCTKIHENQTVCLPSMNNQPVDGTLCGPNKWCINGRCTSMNYRADTTPIHGGWSPWTPWSSCSHTCGLGVEYQQRTCTNPKPDFGGKQCLGVRKRYRTCSLASCKKSSVLSKHESHLNCEELNAKSNGTKWKTVPWFTRVPCMVFCTQDISPLSLNNDTSTNGNMTLAGDEVSKIESIKFRDGTLCTMENDDDDNKDFMDEKGMCIAGQCQKLGCDNQLYSTTIEDECGICNGNRSHCQQKNKLFEYKKPTSVSFGSYVKIGNVSKGIATFKIEKTTHANHFLAIKVKDRYYLNGNRSITSNKAFRIGQTRLWYKRDNKHEILEARGYPLTEEIDLMLLILNNDLIKVKYIYWDLVNQTKSNLTKIQNHYYLWRFDNDTNDDCSCTTQQPSCTFQSYQNEIIVVSDELCDSKTKPRPRKCSTAHCSERIHSTPRWHVGPWRACEGRCWPQEAIQRRSLLCVRTMSNNKTHTIPTSICTQRFPSIPITIRECPQNLSSAIPKCHALKIYHQWNTSEWKGNCSSKNPCAMQYRTVTCISYDSNSICTADERLKPIDRRTCNSTCGQWFVSHWSENCVGPCNNATLVRRVWCNSSICNQDQRPFSIRRCIPAHCANQSIYKNQTIISTQLTTTKTISKITKLTSATSSIKKPTTTSARTHPFTVAKKTTTTTKTTIRQVKLTTKTSSRRG